MKFDGRTSARGTALFLILMTVALFAALSYAVTQSGRGAGGISKEQLDLGLAEALSYMEQVGQAVDRMILTGRCTQYTIRFWHPDRINAGNPSHYGDGSNPECQVFDMQGGGVPYKLRPKALGGVGADEYPVSGFAVLGLGKDNLTDNDGDGHADGTDLVIWINVSKEACLRVNDRLGINNPSGLPPIGAVSGAGVISPGTSLYNFPQLSVGYVLPPFGSMLSGAAALKNTQTGCWGLGVLDPPFNFVYHAILIR